MRIGLLLKHFFSQPESRYGDGFFSSVLVELLRDSELATHPAMRDVLRFVSVPPPMNSSNRDDCAAAIESRLADVAKLLKTDLAYEVDQAKPILADALANFVDERFSITAGRALGLYREPA